ncbi:MAG: T9SS type A sorting domain-containing protein [Bacteroidales bacterium]|nr:T9SS type A sorting domain-containing protein [Bacteroidales bacterium]
MRESFSCRQLLRYIFVIAIFLQVTSVLSSQSFVPGESYYGRNNYIQYDAGNLPIIISAPHGGALTPGEIPDRTCGDETVTDSYTSQLALEIAQSIKEITGCNAHVILCHLKRTKLDANREIEIAACGNEYAEIAWNEYHKYIDSAKAIITRTTGKGLFIDLHGHGHSIQRLELGYLLSATQLRYSDATLNTAIYKNISSIRNLIYSNIGGQTHSVLLRGSQSLGSLFSASGYPSVPSTDDPYPQVGDTYFSGGYNTERHGSRDMGFIDGIQVECNQDVRFTIAARQAFANQFGAVLLAYLDNHYFSEQSLYYCNSTNIESEHTDRYLLYPNPVQDRLFFHNAKETDMILYDINGRIVISKRLEEISEVSLDNLHDGLYLVILRSQGKVVLAEKLIKMAGR